MTLFRTISSGKFLDIYNAFASGPLLVDTINFLTSMLHSPASQADKVLPAPMLVQLACIVVSDQSLLCHWHVCMPCAA